MTEPPQGRLDQWVLGLRAFAGAEYPCAGTWSGLSWRDWDLLIPPEPQRQSLWITLTQAAAVHSQQPCERLLRSVQRQAPQDARQAVQVLRSLLPARAVQLLADADRAEVGRCVGAGGLAILALTDTRSAPTMPPAWQWALVTGVSDSWSLASSPTAFRPASPCSPDRSAQAAPPSALWVLAPWLDDVWGLAANAKLVPASPDEANTSLQLRSLDGHVQAVQVHAAVGVFPPPA